MLPCGEMPPRSRRGTRLEAQNKGEEKGERGKGGGGKGGGAGGSVGFSPDVKRFGYPHSTRTKLQMFIMQIQLHV